MDLATPAEEIPAADYDAGLAVLASAISPWMRDVAPDRWAAAVADLRGRGVGTLLSTHGLAASGAVGRLPDRAAGLPTGPAFVPPGQEFVEAVLAAAGSAR